MTVSAYFRYVRARMADETANQGKQSTVDEFFQANLPYICMWTSLRYLLFSKLLANISEIFWYEDAIVDPLDWSARFLSFVGVNLPLDELVVAATAAGAGGSILGFYSKGFDVHPGVKGHPSNRSFVDVLDEVSLASMDDVVRNWLPPVLLKRFGVAPY